LGCSKGQSGDSDHWRDHAGTRSFTQEGQSHPSGGVNVGSNAKWWVEAGKSMQDDSSVGDIIDGKDQEGGWLGGTDVGVGHNGEHGVVKQVGSGLMHVSGLMLHIKNGEALHAITNGL